MTVRSKMFKYIRNFYPDLPNTPSADAFVSDTFIKMRELKQKGELTEAQMACFMPFRAEEELYDVINDPYELKNLAGNPEAQETLEEMRTALKQIRSLSNDSLPAFRTPDEFDRQTGKPNDLRKRPRPSKKEMAKIIREMNDD